MEEPKLPAPPANASIWKRLIIPWGVCLIAAIFYAYDFLLRVAPSVMITPLMHSLSVDATTIGFISAFYYYAYTPLQIPSGIVVDRFNVQLVLFTSVLLCVIGAVLFAFIPSLPVILFSRFLMGIGSAFAFVGTLKLASRWLPRNQFALFAGVTTTLGTLGAVGADWTLSRLVTKYGWQQATLLSAYAGIVICILILLFVRNKPSWWNTFNTPKASWKITFLKLWVMLKTPGIWYNGLVGSILFLPINVIASLWGVAFLIHAKHFSSTSAASVTALIFIGAAVGAPLSGWFSDFMKSRKIPLYLGTICVLTIVILLIYTNITSYNGICILLFLLGFFSGTQILVFAVAREISPPRSTGISTAATNFLVTIGAAVFQPLIGFLLDLSWHRGINAQTHHNYSPHDFKIAFSLIPFLFLMCFILIYLMPKTACKKVPGNSI